MKKFRGIFKSMLIVVIAIMAFSFTSCTERVPPGYKGMILNPSGFQGDVLEPGNHTCYNRDKLVLLENAETNYTAKMNVLCKDELNFSFDVNVLARLRENSGESYNEQIANILDRQGGKITWESAIGTLDFDVLYNTYVAPKVDAVSRSTVSKYETTQIRENRDAIEKAITTKIMAAVGSTPVEIVTVVTSNFDYPDVITEAQERRKQREIALKEEDAKQALELKKMENRKKLAEDAKIVRMREAEAEAIYNRIVGQSLTQSYLKLRAIENQGVLYRTEGVSKVIVPEGSTPFISQ